MTDATDTTYYPYLGSGKLYARPAGSTAGYFELGNASKVEIAVKDKTIDLQDNTKPGGGTYASAVRIEGASVNMVLNDLNKGNVSRALFGSDTAVQSGAVTAEAITAHLGALCPLEQPNAAAVVVKNAALVGASAIGTITYAAGTDYELRPSGLFILPGGTITDAQALTVAYTYALHAKIEAMTTSAPILELRFEGLNESAAGKPVLVHIYKLQLSAAKALSLLGDKFSDLTVDGKILIDPTKTGAGVSKYFKVVLT